MEDPIARSRAEVIQRVRDKAAALSEELSGPDLARARPYTNLEVCTLLDVLDQLTRKHENLKEVIPHDHCSSCAEFIRRIKA